MTTDSLDTLFCQAVTALDAGDVNALKQLLADHPELARERLETPGAWLRDKVGRAVDAGEFFERPYLLWFVAEDPVRQGSLPKNIAEIARAIIDAARSANLKSLQEQLHYTLQLVSLSWIARECGVQIELIDVLMDAGASPDGHPDHALVNGNFEAMKHLLARGAKLTLPTAICLERWDDASSLWESADDRQKQFALVAAALHGRANAVKWVLRKKIDLNRPSEDLFSHGTPLHHAVCSGSMETVRSLVEAGARLDAKDTAWNGTPLDWAEYQMREAKVMNAAKPYPAIAAYLREKAGRT